MEIFMALNIYDKNAITSTNMLSRYYKHQNMSCKWGNDGNNIMLL